jgi:Flp pilus assembly protein TadB
MNYLTVSDRLYRGLLVLYPAAFRREFGPDMAQVFRDTCRMAARRGGTGAVMGVWLGIAWDLLLTAGQQRLADLFQRESPMDTATFDHQLSNTIRSMIVLLRSGYSVKQCANLLADHAPEPTASVFKNFVSDLENGKNIFDAFEELHKRVPSDLLATVVSVMLKQRAEGGNLADRLEPVALAIEDEAGDDEAAGAALQHFREMTAVE